MNQHKASNGASVHLDSNGRMTFRRDSPLCVNTLEAFWVQAAREYFQAERDEELGRWRDPENPDYVAYRTPEDDDGCGRCILLLDENTGDNHWEWERIATSGPGLRYFAAHPEPKPWEEAKAGEVWILTRYGAEEPFFVTGGEFTSTDLAVATDLDDLRITDGRRIWPEEDK